MNNIVRAAQTITANWGSHSPLVMAQALAAAGLLVSDELQAFADATATLDRALNDHAPIPEITSAFYAKHDAEHAYLATRKGPA